MERLRGTVRVNRNQNLEPSIGIIDSQSVKWGNNRSLNGIDGNKKVKGIKRHIVVDKNGFLIAVMVTIANIHDSKAAYLLMRVLKELCSGVKVILADGVILSVIAFFNFTVWLLERGYEIECQALSSATFFIYTFHMFLALMITNMIFTRLIPQSETYWVSMLICYLFTPPMAIAICLLVQNLMKRICPRILSVLTGSREYY